MEDLVPFILRLWFWGWRTLLALFVGFVVVVMACAIYRFKKYKKCITHPTDWLLVMSKVRFDPIPSLCELMNTKLGVTLFEVKIISSWKMVSSSIITLVQPDLEWLESRGLAERRVVYVDRNNNKAPEGEEPICYDTNGNPTFNRNFSKTYRREEQWKSTGKGGGTRKKTHSINQAPETELENGLLPT